MKPILFSGLLLASTFISAQVTFTTQTSGTLQSLRGTTLIDGTERGWAVGAGGTILYTTDGGQTWTSQISPETVSYEDITYGGTDVDGDDYVWAAGSAATVIHTIDDGATWESQTGGAPFSCYAINFQGIANGIMMGEGFYATSINGGNVFSPVMTSYTYYAVDFVGSTGWTCGNDGFIKKTTDGGTSWIDQTSGTLLGLRGIDFINANEGWACGFTGTILHTTDGGTTWTAQTSGTGNLLSEIKFADSQNGWACGYTGTILRTADGGATWTNYALEAGTLVWLHSIALINAYEGWIVGDNGVIITFSAEDAGIRDNSDIQLSVYPNPAINKLTIETEAIVQTIEIFDISGAMIQQETTTNFSIAALETGVYFIHVNTSEGLVTKRFIKQ